MAAVDLQLVGEDLLALGVDGGVAGVDGPELAHPDRRAGLTGELAALQNFFLTTSWSYQTPLVEPGRVPAR
jgi:hypothetical protein